MIVPYQSHLLARGLFPSDIGIFIQKSISREDWDAFVKYPDTKAKHPDSISLISSTGDVTINTPDNPGLSANIQSTYSQTASFKKSIKRDAFLAETN